jgi:predicted GNAT family acetyltransferase
MNPNDRGSAALTAKDVEFSDNDVGGEFTIERDGQRIAEMTFLHDGPKRARFDHTFVTPELRGGGVARLLLDAAVEWARRTGIRIVPECSYVRAAFARDPKIRDVLA